MNDSSDLRALSLLLLGLAGSRGYVFGAGSYQFCHCIVERKSGRIRCVNPWKATLLIVLTTSASLAPADDFKTLKGKEYKNATVSRVEADGIVIKPNPESQRFTSLNFLKTFRNGFITVLRPQLERQ